MDTQQILTSLAALKDNLSAIESARSQVQANVSAYDKVQKQLADTSINISNILSGFTALTDEIKAHQQVVNDDMDNAKNDVISIFQQKALAISTESDSVINTLKTTLKSFDDKMSITTDEIISKISSEADECTTRINDEFQKAQTEITSTSTSAIEDFATEVQNFRDTVSSISTSFGDSLKSQLSGLSNVVDKHIEKYQNLQNTLSSEIDKLKTSTDKLSEILSNFQSTVDKKITDSTDHLEELIKGVAGTVKNAKQEIATKVENTVSTSESAIKKEVADCQKTIKKDAEKYKDEISDCIKHLDERINKGLEQHAEQVAVLTKQGRKTNLLLIGVIAMVVISIVLNFLK